MCIRFGNFDCLLPNGLCLGTLGIDTSNNDHDVLYAFVRSTMEYGCLVYMGAKKTHLKKLDMVQRKAERICKRTVAGLGKRRAAAAYGFACKLLDGNGRGELQQFVPQVVVNEKSGKIGLESLRTVDSTAYFDDSLAGQLDLIFAQLPQDLLYYQV